MANKNSPASHAVDFRITIPWHPKPLYLVLLVGKNRRLQKIEQGSERRSTSPLKMALLASLVLTICTVGGLLLLFFSAYLIKSKLGIDLVPNSSPVPEFLKYIGLCH